MLYKSVNFENELSRISPYIVLMSGRCTGTRSQRAIKNAKTHFYRDRVMQLKQDDPSSWYRHIKLMSSSSQTSQIINVPGVNQAKPAIVANIINGHFADVSANMSPLATQCLPSYLPATHPQSYNPGEVFKELSKVKPGKSAGPDGIPAKLVHLFAAELSTPPL